VKNVPSDIGKPNKTKELLLN